MNELKTKAATQNFESAYALYNTAGQGLNLGPEMTGSQTDPEVSLTVSQSATQAVLNCIGFMHCHLDNGTTFQVFSFSDIIALANIANASTRPTQELVVYVTTANGTFALKVSNKIVLANNLLRMSLAQNWYERDYDKAVDKEKPIEDQAVGFLKFINSAWQDTGSGLDLYQQNDSGDWEKLTLSSNKKNINRKKC